AVADVADVEGQQSGRDVPDATPGPLVADDLADAADHVSPAGAPDRGRDAADREEGQPHHGQPHVRRTEEALRVLQRDAQPSGQDDRQDADGGRQGDPECIGPCAQRAPPPSRHGSQSTVVVRRPAGDVGPARRQASAPSWATSATAVGSSTRSSVNARWAICGSTRPSRPSAASTATTIDSASIWKYRRAPARVSAKPNPSAPSEDQVPGTQRAIWSGTARM